MPGADIPPILAQDFDAGSLYALRAAVAAHDTRAGMPEPRAGDIVLAVHELAVNAIRHGAGHGRLRISEHDGALHCQVTDDGTPPAATGSPGPGPPAPARVPLAQRARPRTVGGPPGRRPRQRAIWPRGTIATASFTFPPHGQQQPLARSQ